MSNPNQPAPLLFSFDDGSQVLARNVVLGSSGIDRSGFDEGDAYRCGGVITNCHGNTQTKARVKITRLHQANAVR